MQQENTHTTLEPHLSTDAILAQQYSDVYVFDGKKNKMVYDAPRLKGGVDPLPEDGFLCVADVDEMVERSNHNKWLIIISKNRYTWYYAKNERGLWCLVDTRETRYEDLFIQ